MKIEDQVVSLELSKKLKEAGYPQEGLWCHIDNGVIGYEGIKLVRQTQAYKLKKKLFDAGVIKYCVAPTVAELGEALPKYYATRSAISTIYERMYQCWDSERKEPLNEKWAKTAGTEADARAKMWLYLKENGLL